MEFTNKVAERAATYQPIRALLTVLALPFYVLGVIAAVVWLMATWTYAAAATGFADARDRAAGGSDE